MMNLCIFSVTYSNTLETPTDTHTETDTHTKCRYLWIFHTQTHARANAHAHRTIVSTRMHAHELAAYLAGSDKSLHIWNSWRLHLSAAISLHRSRMRASIAFSSSRSSCNTILLLLLSPLCQLGYARLTRQQRQTLQY